MNIDKFSIQHEFFMASSDSGGTGCIYIHDIHECISGCVLCGRESFLVSINSICINMDELSHYCSITLGDNQSALLLWDSLFDRFNYT